MLQNNFEKILNDYWFVVGHTISKYRRFVDGVTITREDLEQEGMIGLWHAWRKYDGRKSVKFSSYAYFWVRRYIVLFLKRMIRSRKYLDRVCDIFEDEREFYDSLAFNDDSYSMIEKQNEIEVVKRAMLKLDERERKILFYRFSDSKNLKNVCRKEFNVSPARAYTIANNAINKLKRIINNET